MGCRVIVRLKVVFNFAKTSLNSDFVDAQIISKELLYGVGGTAGGKEGKGLGAVLKEKGKDM